MLRLVCLALLLSVTNSAQTQNPAPAATSTPSTLRSSTSLVIVPTLVQTPTGDLIPGLKASDFSITDNGVEQKISVEEVGQQPVAIVILLQTGGAARAQFANYRNLGPMIDYLAGASAHRVALVTFDSQPEEVWDLSAQTSDLKEAFAHPSPGDDEAALLDAVSFGIDLLKPEPESTRRIILLVSQPHDSGSKATPEDIVRRLGETGTTIYTISFSPEKKWLEDQFTKPRHENPPYQFAPNIPPLIHTFNLDTPLRVALNAMRTDTASGIASLSGGEHLRFDGRHDLEQKLSVIANHVPNRYILSFRPTSREPGFHTLKVTVLHQSAPADVSARSGYWSK